MVYFIWHITLWRYVSFLIDFGGSPLQLFWLSSEISTVTRLICLGSSLQSLKLGKIATSSWMEFIWEYIFSPKTLHVHLSPCFLFIVSDDDWTYVRFTSIQIYIFFCQITSTMKMPLYFCEAYEDWYSCLQHYTVKTEKINPMPSIEKSIA